MRDPDIDPNPDDPSPWKVLGGVDPEDRFDARLQLHHAVQLLASFGQVRVEPRDDDSHRSMTWDPGVGGFQSEEDDEGLRVTLRVREMRLALERDGEEHAPFSLQGRRLSEARAWLGRMLGEALDASPRVLPWPEFDIPPHAVGDSDPFRAEPSVLDELARWYDDTHHLLSPLVRTTDEASALRCWPHHFDLATLVSLDAGPEGGRADDATTIGVGMTPGDASYGEPYWYVTPWPRPDDAAELPALDGPGHWHREGWVGAVLTASELLDGPAGGQAERARRHLDAGLEACQALFG